jgi:putative flippase GtrA
MGFSATKSNAIGYAFGAVLSYYLNKRYTFKTDGNSRIEALKFFMVLGISYLLNFLALQWFLTLLNPYIAQLFSAIIYTLSSFLLAKFFVFKTSKDTL